ncbi:hypothetical protein EJ08DRAFT_725580 [Tothia fuscella]|uniref:VLRF1 domain-containing protein n=1 Tax=Tothia fuscella TaxID=1048955 RepID=A0A9P4P072_9PEZI|nr:hypothetical protein EJ08DRAFT_725580 [Tothia fuscella]
MVPKEQKEPDILHRPLYSAHRICLVPFNSLTRFLVFDLPDEIIHTLTLKSELEGPVEPSASDSEPLPKPTDGVDSSEISPAKATSCSLCNLTFPTLEKQRGHVRSDLHNYNLKQKIRGLPAVEEAEFEKLIGELDESISGSDSSESDSEDDATKVDGGGAKDTTLSALLKKQAKLSHPEDDPFSRKSRKQGTGKVPLIWFSSPSLPENTALGVYRAVFSLEDQEEPLHLADSLRKKQIASVAAVKKSDQAQTAPIGKTSPHYFLCMVGGGHFAAMIVSLAPKTTKKHTGHSERQATVLAHKTFHRYTTRRKQGGSQSAHDAKGAASSAGASLRRYNEAALITDVRSLLAEWKGMIDSSELIFIRATGNTNRQTLFGPYDGQVLRQNEPRNRGFPFTTRRATQAELMRAFVELTRLKVSQIDEKALAAAAAEREKEEARNATPVPKAPKPPKLSEEEEAALLHTTQLQTLIKRSKAPALLNYIKSNTLSPDFRFYPAAANHHSPTPLHLASSLSSPALITALLVKGGANPALLNEDSKTAFDIAGDRPMRDAFRLARHTLGENAWDWNAANIGSALSQAEVNERAETEKAEQDLEAKKEAERRKVETERLRKEDQDLTNDKREKKMGKGRTLVAEKTGAERREEETRGLTPEMRMKLERERRARAAEERMRRA